MTDDALTLDPDYLATDPADNEDPNGFPLEATFMSATARELNERTDKAVPPHVSVNLHGPMGQRNLRFPMESDWFTAARRDYELKAVGVAASPHGTDVTGYYVSQNGAAYTLKRKVDDRETFDGGTSDWTLNEWATKRVPAGVVWIHDDVALEGFDA